jgi:hypothetical protein
VASLLAAAGLTPRGVHYSGIGAAEAINALLLGLLWPSPALRRLYGVLQYLYYTAYMAEDTLSLGPLSYHLMVVASRAAEALPKAGTLPKTASPGPSHERARGS